MTAAPYLDLLVWCGGLAVQSKCACLIFDVVSRVTSRGPSVRGERHLKDLKHALYVRCALSSPMFGVRQCRHTELP